MKNTRVHLLNVPTSIDEKHQFYAFSNADQQSDFYYNNFRIASERARVLLEPIDGSFRMQIPYETASKANYMMFRNPSYGNKFFYAYITDIVPQSGNEQVEIHYYIDSMQSYLFEVVRGIKPSTVIREHISFTSSDDYTMHEDISPGRLETKRVISGVQNKSKYKKDVDRQDVRWAVLTLSKSPYEVGFMNEVMPNPDSANRDVGGIPQTLYHIAVPFDITGKGRDVLIKTQFGNKKVAAVSQIIDHFSKDEMAANTIERVTIKNDLPIEGLGVRSSSSNIIISGLSFLQLPSLSLGSGVVVDWDLTPKNKINTKGSVIAQANNKFAGLHSNPRLNRPPFTRFFIESEDGAQVEFHPDDIKGNELKLIYRTNMGPIDSSVLQVDTKRFSGSNDMYDIYSEVSSSKTLATRTSATAAVLQSSQNQIENSRNNNKIDLVKNTIIGGGSAAIAKMPTGSPTAMLASGAVGAIKGAYDSATASAREERAREAQFADLENRPDSIGNVGADISFNMINKRTKNMIKIKTMIPENKRSVEDYFKENGYKVSRIKRPNLKTRRYWNYVEGDIRFTGSGIPVTHQARIREIFASGVTFWHDKDIYNYNRNNSVR